VILGVPTLYRYDLLARMLASVDVPARVLVIDNGGSCPDIDGTVIRLPTNLGVAASWNLIMKVTPDAPWWAIVNDDIVFAPTDLPSLTDAMADPSPRVVTLDGFAAFGINRACVDRVGLFDENFHPAYCEDADYEYRCRLADVPIIAVPANLRHDRSSLIADPRYKAENDRTYPENRAYFIAKWGGDLRGGETFDSPFDAGGTVDEWTLSTARVRELAWHG
jgi:GT2 family glycosyltransferase